MPVATEMNIFNLVVCPCCGNRTLSELGEYEICPVCLWEDDPVQLSDPNYVGGANTCSLKQAREEWLRKTNKY